MSELGDLAADLSGAGRRILPYARAAVEHTAFQIKKDWAAGAKVSARVGERNFAPAYASSIDYDMKHLLTGVEAEIGPDPSKAGGTAGFLEDAPGGVRSAPQHAGRDALEAGEADFEKGLAKAAEDAILKGRGL